MLKLGHLVLFLALAAGFSSNCKVKCLQDVGTNPADRHPPIFISQWPDYEEDEQDPDLWPFPDVSDDTNDDTNDDPVIMPFCRVHKNGTADCANSGIKQLEDLPHLPSNITVLNLSDNDIQDLPNGGLANFSALITLDLTRNQLTKLNNDSFYNLSNLHNLTLNGNKLALNETTYPSEVFAPLVSLKKLLISNNTKEPDDTSLSYPDKAFAKLTNLESLYIDGLTNKSFGSNFAGMKKLRSLTLDGRVGQCRLTSLPQNMFKYLSQLEHLAMRGCHIKGPLMDSKVFQPLQKLHSLDVSKNSDIQFEPLGEALTSLKNAKNLTYLVMQTVVNPFSPGVCLTAKFAKSLPRHLKSLVASSNSIETVENHVFDNLPENLTRLDLTNNRLVFGRYLQYMGKMKKLHILILDGGQGPYALPTYYPNDTKPEQCGDTIPGNAVNHKKLIQSLPPSLENVKIRHAGWYLTLTEFQFNANNSLKIIHLDGNYFPYLVGPITGLNNVKYLNLKNCNIYSIFNTFFNSLSSLEHLDLHNNYFGRASLQNGSKPIFTRLKNLTNLVLRNTGIKVMDYHALEGLDSMEILDLSQNVLSNFDVNISHMYNLRLLNLSNSEIYTLSPNTYRTIDMLWNHSGLSVDISRNPLHCFCDNIDFIKWIITSPAMPKEFKEFKCVFMDGSEKYVTDFDAVYQTLVGQCASNFPLFVSVIATTSLTLSLIIVAMAYSLRWQLRYLYYITYLRIMGQDNNSCKEHEYENDAFVSYADIDESFLLDTLRHELEPRGVRLHIRTRDEATGDYIANNIVNAVHRSRKTLVILTRDLLKRRWTKYEIEMANMESVHTSRPVLIFLIKENQLQDIGTDMLYHVKNNSYIYYPQNPQEHGRDFMKVFWDKLARDLKGSKRRSNLSTSSYELSTELSQEHHYGSIQRR